MVSFVCVRVMARPQLDFFVCSGYRFGFFCESSVRGPDGSFLRVHDAALPANGRSACPLLLLLLLPSLPTLSPLLLLLLLPSLPTLSLLLLLLSLSMLSLPTRSLPMLSLPMRSLLLLLSLPTRSLLLLSRQRTRSLLLLRSLPTLSLLLLLSLPTCSLLLLARQCMSSLSILSLCMLSPPLYRPCTIPILIPIARRTLRLPMLLSLRILSPCTLHQAKSLRSEPHNAPKLCDALIIITTTTIIIRV